MESEASAGREMHGRGPNRLGALKVLGRDGRRAGMTGRSRWPQTSDAAGIRGFQRPPVGTWLPWTLMASSLETFGRGVTGSWGAEQGNSAVARAPKFLRLPPGECLGRS